MKKWIAALLCVAMLLSLAACGGTTSESSGQESQSSESSSAAEEGGESSGSVANVELPDEEVTLNVYLHSFNPTVNTEPTEERTGWLLA